MAPGETFPPAQGEQARLLSRAQCSSVVAVTPNLCPVVQKPPSKLLSPILINSFALHVALLWQDHVSVFCIEVTFVL